MPHLPGHVFAIQIVDSERFVARFGHTISGVIWDEIVEGFYKVAHKILSRHKVFSPVVAPFWGRCLIFFQLNESFLPLDIKEQLASISTAGGRMIREMLQVQLGKATGRALSFKISVVPVRKNIQDINGLNKRLDILFKEMENCTDPFSSIPRADIQAIIADQAVQTYFQPIYLTHTEKMVGYEALSRGPTNSMLYEADMLFGTAAYWGLTEALELLCIEQALNWIGKIPDVFWVALNVGPALLKTSAFKDIVLKDQLKAYWPRLVFELTEHLPMDSLNELHHEVEGMKPFGISFSIDDTGCGFADLNTVAALCPKIVKLCITITRRIRKNKGVLEEFNAAVRKLSEYGEIILGEGVEQKEELELLKQTGVSMAQGFYFEKPRQANELFR